MFDVLGIFEIDG